MIQLNQKILIFLAGAIIILVGISVLWYKSNIMNLSYNEFDQTPNKGWRALVSDKSGPVDYVNSAELIDRYINTNQKKLNDSELSILYFHMMQMYAFADNPNAIESTEKSLEYANKTLPKIPLEERHFYEPWILYIEATQAFLKKNKAQFDAIRNTFITKYPDNPNLPIINHMAEQFEASYKDIYKH